MTIANWYTSVCGGTLVTTTTAEHPVAIPRPPPPPSVPETPPQLSVVRPDETTPLDEMAMARAWLQHLRDSAIFKVEGLDATQLRWRPSPTANSLGVIVVHLGYCRAALAPRHLRRRADGHGLAHPDVRAARRLGRSTRSSRSTGPRAPWPTPSSTGPPRSTFPLPATCARPRCAGRCSTSLRRRRATSATWTSPASCSTAASAAEQPGLRPLRCRGRRFRDPARPDGTLRIPPRLGAQGRPRGASACPPGQRGILICPGVIATAPKPGRVKGSVQLGWIPNRGVDP